ncbi:hypothetical protein NM688_g6880 [Phlebia brevispora]|uniref:Uncharacterized protein n=1 Tax=Phlebia brevispora TaxID=194682 RepID=A0ACC1SBT9_9APHY|nr:hypothetical protein NM688_g6880 [Phlebia brevispora]
MFKPKQACNLRAIWNFSDDRVLVDTLLKAKAQGLQIDSGFKQPAYKLCDEALKNSISGSPKKTAFVCKTRYGKFKADYSIIKKLHASQWKTYLQTNFKAKPFQNKFNLLSVTHSTSQQQSDTSSADNGNINSAELNPPIDPQLLAMGDVEGFEGAQMQDGLEHSDEESQVEEPETPVKTGCKRSAIEDLSPSPQPQRKRSCTFGADAIFGVASTIRAFSSTLNANGSTSSQGESSLQRRAHVIHLVEDDADISDNEAVAIAKMFHRDMDIIDTYLGISSETCHIKYLRSELDNFTNNKL